MAPHSMASEVDGSSTIKRSLGDRPVRFTGAHDNRAVAGELALRLATRPALPSIAGDRSTISAWYWWSYLCQRPYPTFPRCSYKIMAERVSGILSSLKEYVSPGLGLGAVFQSFAARGAGVWLAWSCGTVRPRLLHPPPCS